MSDGKNIVWRDFFNIRVWAFLSNYVAFRDIVRAPSGIATCRQSSVNALTEDGRHMATGWTLQNFTFLHQFIST